MVSAPVGLGGCRQRWQWTGREEGRVERTSECPCLETQSNTEEGESWSGAVRAQCRGERGGGEWGRGEGGGREGRRRRR